MPGKTYPLSRIEVSDVPDVDSPAGEMTITLIAA